MPITTLHLKTLALEAGSRRGVFSALIGFTIGIVVSAQLTTSLLHQLIAGALATLIVYRTHNPIAPLLTLLLSIAGFAMLFELMRTRFVVRMSLIWVVVFITLLVVLFTLLWQRDTSARLSWVDVVQTVSTAWVVWFFARTVSWNAGESLITIAASGEDNGSWLDGIARVLQRNASLDSSEIVLGGSVGSVMASLFVGLGQRSEALVGNALDVATLTIRSYWVVTVIAALVSARLAYRLCLPVINRYAPVPAALAAVGTVLYATGMQVVGHLTALNAAAFMITALALFAERPYQPQVSAVLSVVALWSFASAWFPLYALTFFVGGVAFARWLVRNVLNHNLRNGLTNVFRRINNRSAMWSTMYWVAAVGLLGLVSRFVLWPIARLFTDLDYVRFTLSLDGGYATVSIYVVLLTFVLSIACIAMSSSNHHRQLFMVAVYGAMAFAIALVVVGFLQAPYDPQYGAYKTLHLVCMSLVPVALAGLTVLLHRLFRSNMHVAFAVATLVLGASVTYWQPYPQVKSLVTRPTPAWWVDAALRELSDNPSQTILCLDSRKDGWRGIDGYNCTRLVVGIQGRTTDETNIWTAANICAVYSSQVASIKMNFWKNVTILVTDGNRLVNSDNCDFFEWAGPNGETDSAYPIGWLSGVPWKTVRVIGPDGREVKKTFEYIRGDFGYPDEVIDRLEQSLRS